MCLFKLFIEHWRRDAYRSIEPQAATLESLYLPWMMASPQLHKWSFLLWLNLPWPVYSGDLEVVCRLLTNGWERQEGVVGISGRGTVTFPTPSSSEGAFSMPTGDGLLQSSYRLSDADGS